jgi:hypothetical protein
MENEKNERKEKLSRIKHLTENIKNLLLTDARYRDSDSLLVNRIQRDELMSAGKDVRTLTVYEFFTIRLNKQITSEDTITRLRREVQEYFPETRGLKYKSRQSKQVEVIDDLHKVEDSIKAPLTQDCFLCQGSGDYESHTCNVCSGTGQEIIK